MTPRDLAAAIRKRGWLIIAITVLAALIATIIARVQTPTYKVELAVSAVAPLNPSTKQPDATIAGAYVVTMASIASASEGIDVAQAASESLASKGINIPAEELLSKVKAEAEVQTPYMKLTFSDSSPTRVAEIANTWGEALETLTGDDPEKQDANFKSLVLNGKLLVTNKAIPPSKPSQPKPLVYLGLGTFVGLVLGFGLVIGIEFFDPHFRSAQEVEETLELPVVGIIPSLKEAEATRLLTSRAEASPLHDAFSQLRTTIMFTLADRPFKSVLVTSAISTPESVYIPANLAVSIAYTKRRTLLMDADMREKAVSAIFGAADKPGLADSLAGGGRPEPKIVETGIPDLDFLPAGITTEASSDLLSLPLMDEYLRSLENAYDRVIIAAPPLTVSVDGVIVASKADLSLVVIDAQRCSRRIALTALETFDLLHMKPTGAVLSNVKVSRRERALYAQKPAVAARPGKPPAVAALDQQPRPSRAKPPKPERKKEKETAARASGKTVPPRPSPPPPAQKAAPETGAYSRSRIAAEDDLQQMQAIVEDDFRRLGATGAPIPKQWLRALNSPKPDVRESAEAAIGAYYQSFLARYKIGEDNCRHITATIIMMMRREGEFANLSEQEAQNLLQKMLIDAGARFSTGDPSGRPRENGAFRERKPDKEKPPSRGDSEAPSASVRETGERPGAEMDSEAGKKRPDSEDPDYMDWE